jgi:hypothetical protein
MAALRPVQRRTRGLPSDEATPALLHERGEPDFRAVYGRLFAEAARVQVAIRKIRLAGMSLSRTELTAPRRIEVVLAEINALTFASEAEALALQTDGRDRLEVLSRLLGSGVLEVRSAPLAGWAPDFSVFEAADAARGGARRALLGPHWFHRPFPHRGPAFASLHQGRHAALAGDRFNELWTSAYDVGGSVRRILERTLQRVPGPASASTGLDAETPVDGGSRRD